MAVTRVLAKRGTAAQIEAVSAADQLAGEIAFATDTKDFYVSDGTQFNKITDLESSGDFYVSGNVGIGTTSIGTAKVVIDHTNTKMLELKRNGATKARFIADSNNGQLDLYDSSTINSVRLLSSGVSYLNGGNVGIGTTSPTDKLDVSGNLKLVNTQDYIKFANDFVTIKRDGANFMSLNSYAGFKFYDTQASSERMRIASDGNVGIGTTSPSALLEIASSSVNDFLKLTSGSGDANPIKLIFEKTSTEQGVIEYNRNGDLEIYNTDNDGGVLISGSGSATTDMYINHSSDVGIGTTSPTSKLHVVGDGQGAGILLSSVDGYNVGRIYNNNSNAFPVGNLTLSYGSTTPAFINAESNGISIRGGATDTAGNNIKFRLYTSEQMRLTPTGLGIGTTSPARKLHVDGSSGARISYESANMDLFYYGIEFNRESNYLRPTTNSDKNLYIGIGSQNDTWGTVFIDSDVVEFRNSSSEPLMRFDSSTGRLGIGTTSPSQALHVLTTGWSGILSESSTTNGAVIRIKNTQREFELSSRSNSFQIRDITDSDTNRFIINSSGNVGIGTTNPYATLTVAGNITQTDNSYLISTRKLTARDAAGLALYNDGGQGIDIKDNNDVIVTSGNVGIGTTSPTSPLHVAGNLFVDGSSLKVANNSVTNYYEGDRMNSYGTYYDWRFAGNTKMRITSSGRLGIGTTSPSYTLDVNGDVNADSGRFNEYLQAPSGIPRANLGDPTVTEMALFESQMSCKTDLSDDYTDLTKVTFWEQPNEGDAWSQVTVSDDNKKKFLRTNNSSIVIPNGTYRYRVEFEPKSYRFAQAFYCYHSYRGNYFAVHVWKRRCSDNQWFQHTDSDVEVGKWPGHLYLPMDDIAWHPTDTTSTYRYNLIRIEFIPNWGASNTNNIDLLGGQLWGGYPAGRRTPHTYDHDGNLTLPANLTVPNDLIVNNGNVGIGTTSPSAKLEILGDNSQSATGVVHIKTSGTSLRLGGNSTYSWIQSHSSKPLYINELGNNVIINRSGGNVGIGTTSPSAKLDVVGNIKIGADQNIFSDGSITIGIDYNNNQTDRVFNIVANNSTEVFRVQEDGKVGIGTTSLSYAFNVNSGGAETVGFFKSNDSRARILISDDDTNTYVGSENGYGFFGGQAGLSAGNLVINSTNGNVGIGTTSPDHLLEVRGTSDALSVGNDTNTQTYMRFAGSRAMFGYTGADAAIQSGSGKGIRFNVNDDSFNSGTAMYITSNGNVGIGTTAPTRTLHVVENNNNVSPILQLEQSGTGNVAIGFKLTNSTEFNMGIDNADGNKFKIHRNYQVGGSGNVLTIDGSNNIGIGTTSPHATALLDVSSTTKGVLFPRMTETQRDAIEEPAKGLIVYQTDGTEGLYIYKSTGWTQII